MRAGDLRNLLRIEFKRIDGKDSVGQPIVTWMLLRKIWGGVLAVRGAETMAADFQRYSSTVYRFRVRRAEAAGVDATMRIIHDGAPYDIRNVMPDEQSREDCLIEATAQNRKV